MMDNLFILLDNGHTAYKGGIMINIYMLEDNEQMMTSLVRFLDRYDFGMRKIHSIDHDFENFVSNHVKGSSNKNIYILDINLESSVNGLMIAKEIRKIDYLGYIIFLTSHMEMAPISYGYHLKAINFIDKSMMDYLMKLEETLDKIRIEMKGHEDEPTLTFKNQDKICQVVLSDIIYIETTHKKRKLSIHTNEESYIYSGTLKQIIEELPAYFKRVHKSFLINANLISEIDISEQPYQIVFRNGARCDISKKFVSDPIGLLRMKAKYEEVN